MNTSLKALNTDADIFSMLLSPDQNLTGKDAQFAELFQSQLTSKFDGVGSIAGTEPLSILNAIQQLSLQSTSTFNLTEDQLSKLNRLLLLATSDEAKAVESQQADLQQNSVSSNENEAALSLGLDLPNNGSDTVVDESPRVEEDLMDTAVVTASQKNQSVNVFVPDTSTQTDGPSFGQYLQQQTADYSKNKDQDADQAETLTQNNTSSSVSGDTTSKVSSQQTAEDKTASDKEQNTSAEKDATDPVDHAIMLAQLMRTSELPVDQSPLKKVAIQEIAVAQQSSLSGNSKADAAADKFTIADQLKSNDRTLNLGEVDDITSQEKTEAGKFEINLPANTKETDLTHSNIDLKDSKNIKADSKDKQDSANDTLSAKTDTNKAISSQNDGGLGNSNNQQFGNNGSNQDSNSSAQTNNAINSTSSVDGTKLAQNQFTSLFNTNAATGSLQAAANTASNVYTQNINTPVGYQNWDQALGQHVGMMLSNSNQSATLSLNPPELGPLQVTVHMQNNGTADATFVTAHAEVRQAIEAAIPKLREMLDQSGIQLGQANINSQTNQGNSQQGQYTPNSQSFRYTTQDNDSDIDEAIMPVMTRRIDQGQGAVDTFA